MKKNKKQRRVMLLLILILSITIGFALLSTTLYINGTAGIKGNTWNIHWDDTSINVTTGSVSATDPVVSTVTSSKDTVSFDVEFEMPGDFYEFEIDAVNEGTVDGALDLAQNWITYTINDQSASLPSYMDFKVTYDDDSVPQSGDILSKRVDANTPGRQKYKIRVEFKSGVEELPSNPQPVTITVELPYVQYKEEPTPQPVDEFGYNVDSGDSVTYYAPGITANGVSTLDPTWTVFGYDNATKDEQKVCIVYNNEKVCSKAYDTWDCQPNSNYTHCTNEDSPIYKMEGKLTPILGQGMEIYITPPTGIQYYKVIGNYSVGFTMDAYETDAYTQDGLCKYISTGTSKGFGCFLP